VPAVRLDRRLHRVTDEGMDLIHARVADGTPIPIEP
jgi:pentose-5-phosphate-3-epimerase